MTAAECESRTVTSTASDDCTTATSHSTESTTGGLCSKDDSRESTVSADSRHQEPSNGKDVPISDESEDQPSFPKVVGSPSDLSSGDGSRSNATTIIGSPNDYRTHIKGMWIHRKPRCSRLDISDNNSEICKSEFRGFLNLLYIFAITYVMTNPVYRFYETGAFIDASLGKAMFGDFFILMGAWGGCILWSFNAHLATRLYMNKRIGLQVLKVVQHSTQVLLFGSCIALILYHKWAVFPSVFVCILGSIYGMKMHSYVSSCVEFVRSGPPNHVVDKFPKVCTVGNFVYFLIAPVLVYEISYPRNAEFRIWYFLEKLNHMIISMMMMYLTVTTTITPIVKNSYKYSFLYTLTQLVAPVLAMDFMAFFFLFECVCNLLAEVTLFADRDFYEDWWNSTNWDEYARKWNKPVHHFLSRHVYMASHQKFNLSKRGSSIATFLFSAIMHEIILATCLRVARFYLLILTMFQLPLIRLGNLVNKSSKTGGNLIFWFGILVGVPVLEVCYAREWSAMLANDSTKFERLRMF